MRRREAGRATLTGVGTALVVVATAVAAQASPTPAPSDLLAPPAPALVLQPWLPGAATTPPTAAGVARTMRGLLPAAAVGPQVSVEVALADDGSALYAQGAARPVLPASTAKLLTAVTALDTLGPGTRLVTATRLAVPPPTATPTATGSPATSGPTSTPAARPATVVLVGGGDASLTVRSTRVVGAPSPASLAALAARTAARLRERGVSRVRLAYDTSLFGGPAVSPAWKPEYVSTGEIAPVTALMADEGRVTPGGDRRWPDPASAAAQAFGRLLGRAGVAVAGAPTRLAGPGAPATQAGATAPGDELARVESPPVSALVAQMLTESDNQLAEALGRLAALASGRAGSFDGATRTVAATLARLGVPVSSLRLSDCSGLARSDRVTVRTLVGTLVLAARGDRPDLRPVASGLPVAGFTGTLDDRFRLPPARRGAGLVRAKTGTLTGVVAEAGLVPTRSGALLSVAVVADRVDPSGADAARTAIDEALAALSGCGCG